jgi:hypothetical protein
MYGDGVHLIGPLPLKISVDQSNRPCDLKKKLFPNYLSQSYSPMSKCTSSVSVTVTSFISIEPTIFRSPSLCLEGQIHSQKNDLLKNKKTKRVHLNQNGRFF